jgi:Low psii accumulation1 / Rep27
VFYAFCTTSASIGLLISLPQLVAALAHTSGALGVQDVGVNIGVNATAVALFTYLFIQDWKVGNLGGGKLCEGGIPTSSFRTGRWEACERGKP